MNIEKFVNSKLYIAFEWFYRLLTLNILTIITSCLLPVLPFIFWLQNKSSVFLLIFWLILFVFSFLPCYITIFMVIKHYKDEKTGNVFVLFFVFLIDTFLRIYRLEFILIPIFIVCIIGSIYYWDLLGQTEKMDFAGVVAVIGFVLLFFLLIASFFAFLHLPMIISYFRMTTYNLIKFSYLLAFKYFLKTIIYMIVLLGPFLLVNYMPMTFGPFYLLYGISFPLFLMYNFSKGLFWYLQNNLDDIKTENEL